METIRDRPTPRRHGVRPGETFELVLSLLRENGSMSQRQIALEVMEHRGLSVADKTLWAIMRNRLGASLRGLKKREALIMAEGDRELGLWTLKASFFELSDIYNIFRNPYESIDPQKRLGCQ